MSTETKKAQAEPKTKTGTIVAVPQELAKNLFPVVVDAFLKQQDYSLTQLPKGEAEGKVLKDRLALIGKHCAGITDILCAEFQKKFSNQ